MRPWEDDALSQETGLRSDCHTSTTQEICHKTQEDSCSACNKVKRLSWSDFSMSHAGRGGAGGGEEEGRRRGGGGGEGRGHGRRGDGEETYTEENFRTRIMHQRLHDEESFTLLQHTHVDKVYFLLDDESLHPAPHDHTLPRPPTPPPPLPRQYAVCAHALWCMGCQHTRTHAALHHLTTTPIHGCAG